MHNIYNSSIVLSFAGLWLTSMVSGQFEIILGFALIFSFGILHGSNDILLIDSISNSKLKYPFFKVLGTYLLTVFSAVILFYFFPIIALLLFVIFSAFHFGEQHWSYRENAISKKIQNSFYFVYGLLILQMLFILNIEEVIEIVKSITEHTLSEVVIVYAFSVNVILFIVFTIYLLLTSKIFKSVLLLELFYLLIFGIIFNVSTLIWGFTIYFILWHSIPSLFEQVTFIYGDFNKKTIFNYCTKAFPYWLMSLIGIGIVYFIFKDEKMFYAVFFSFIAAVTFPHALVINKMFKNKKTQSSK
jgi:Brp/Blh family beta-carotene 15,15'-monooxygenase